MSEHNTVSEPFGSAARAVPGALQAVAGNIWQSVEGAATREISHLVNMIQGESDHTHDNIRDASSLIQRAQDALAQLEAQLAGIPISQRPADVDSIRSNLMGAMNALQNAPPSARVPESIRSIIVGSARLVTSGYVKQEAEQAETEENYHRAGIAQEIAQERAAQSRGNYSASVASFLRHSSNKKSGDESQSTTHHHLSSSQEREHFITTNDGRRTARKIHGHGYDRATVNVLGGVIGERNADEIVSTTETGLSIVGKGGYAVLTADVAEIDNQSRGLGRGAKNAINDTGLDRGIDWIGHTTGLDQYLGKSAVAQTVGRAVHNTAWGAGRLIATPINLVSTAASYITGAKSEQAKPQTVNLAGSTVEWHNAARLLSKHGVRDMDKNHDGKWSIDEVRNAAANWNKNDAQHRLEEKKHIIGARSQADSNHDGKIDKNELMAAIHKAGKTFAQADTNHDGKISNGELSALATPVAGQKPTPVHGKHH